MKPRGRFLAQDRGDIAIEFAFLAPFLLLLIMVLTDIALAGSMSMQLSNAARAGTQYALGDNQNSAGIEAAVRNSGVAAGVLASPSFSVNVRRFCECDGEGEVACSYTCSSGASSRMFVEVIVDADYATLFPYPIIPETIPLSGTAVLQVR